MSSSSIPSSLSSSSSSTSPILYPLSPYVRNDKSFQSSDLSAVLQLALFDIAAKLKVPISQGTLTSLKVTQIQKAVNMEIEFVQEQNRILTKNLEIEEDTVRYTEARYVQLVARLQGQINDQVEMIAKLKKQIKSLREANKNAIENYQSIIEGLLADIEELNQRTATSAQNSDSSSNTSNSPILVGSIPLNTSNRHITIDTTVSTTTFIQNIHNPPAPRNRDLPDVI